MKKQILLSAVLIVSQFFLAASTERAGRLCKPFVGRTNYGTTNTRRH